MRRKLKSSECTDSKQASQYEVAEVAQTSSEKARRKTSDAERARLRRNQRNSRARRAQYVSELETGWSQIVKFNTNAKAEIQTEARRMYTENAILRTMLRERGCGDGDIDDRLRFALKTSPREPGSNTSNYKAMSCPSIFENIQGPVPGGSGLTSPSNGRSVSCDEQPDLMSSCYTKSAQSHSWAGLTPSTTDFFNGETGTASVVYSPVNSPNLDISPAVGQQSTLYDSSVACFQGSGLPDDANLDVSFLFQGPWADWNGPLPTASNPEPSDMDVQNTNFPNFGEQFFSP